MKTTIHLVRHGEVHNPDNIFYERIPGYFLSEKGKEQVKKLGKHLHNKEIKKIYASPLDRTNQTAEIIATYFPEVTIIHDKRLIEIGSPLHGMPLAELSTHNFNFYDEKRRGDGETIDDIIQRMTSFIKELTTRHEGEEIIAVSHGDPIMITRTYYHHGTVQFEQLRGDEYIETAHGVTLMFEDGNVTLEDIIPV